MTEPNEATQDEEEDTTTQEKVEVTPKSNERVHAEDADADEEDEDDDDVDPVEVAVLARLAQEREKARVEEREIIRLQNEAAAAEYRKSQAEEDKKRKLNDSFTETTKMTKAALEKLPLRTEDGDPIRLTEEMIQQFIEPWRTHNGVVQQTINTTAESEVYSNLAQAAASLVPKDKLEEFAKRAGGKPLGEYLKVVAELSAPDTDTVKNLAEDYEVKVKAAYARGFAKGQKAPPGTPATPQQSNSGGRGDKKEDISSVSGAARALSKGQIDEAKFLEILRKNN